MDQIKDVVDIGAIFENVQRKMGKTNILITGKTGVGKSTLLNSVFGEDLAITGVGKPITQNIQQFSKEGIPVNLVDTRGLELENYEEISNELVSEIKKRKTIDANEHIHIAWYCINYGSKRIEDGEIEFVKRIAAEVPVIVVLTQSIDGNLDFYNEVEKVFYAIAQSVRVLALPFDCGIGIMPTFGLSDLAKLTNEIIPEVQKAAFAAAQKVDMDQKEKAVDKIIAGSATAAAAVGATPIPFADAIALAPIQIGMLAGISLCMGLEVTKAYLTTLVSSAVGVVGAAYIGRAAVSALLKLIPGAGTLVGGVISAGTASALTMTMGYAYKEAIKLLYMNDATIITPELLATTFVSCLKDSKDK